MCVRLISCLLLLVLLVPAGAGATEEIGGLRLSAENSTELVVSWDNPGDVLCKVYSYVEGLDTYYEHSTSDERVTLLLVPGVSYRIVVEDQTSAGTTLEDTVTMPDASAYRGNGYRVSKRRVYVYTDVQKAMWNQSYNNLGTISKEKLLDGIAEGKVYALYFEVEFNRTSEAKVLDPMLVLKTPTGDVYTRFNNQLEFDGSWDGARYYLTFNDLIAVCESSDGLVPGKYSMEAYQEGQTLGTGEFTISE